ncbi:hypothetical protein D9619_010508 [Psilocybe cf. subviscida]|uniref:Uncharacterized protein n=1 Tax=Psilocybe cf. subviscida TaxID=2480587 RepID=A0A8H5ASF0_9AGAR|nr:hypothetical protein D9619_010508 [Psilocybe cf. subviscida]
MASNNPNTDTPLFPAELTDLVVDASRNDRQALAAYALVCKQWTPRSRYHLFERAAIFADNARQFISLLSSPHCTFATAICELDISLAASGSHRWFTEFSRRLLPILAKVSNLHGLAISGSRNAVIRQLDEDSGAREALIAFGRQNQTPSQITALKLGPVTFESLVDFVDVLSAFPDLHTLACAAHFQDATQPEPHGEIRVFPQVTTIDLASPSTNYLLGLLLNQGILPNVTNLSLSRLTGGDLSALTPFLHNPNNNALQNLVIKFDSIFSGVSFDLFAQRVDMTQLRALRHLVVETAPDMPSGPAYTLLSTISWTGIERLEISLLLTEELTCIDNLLTSARFSTLKEVTILSASFVEAGQFLPLCAARNILQQV